MIEDTGKRIKALRTTKKMSMADLAGKIGISKSLISQVERGEVLPSLTTLDKLATALEVPITRFFNIDVDITEEENILVRKDKRKKVSIPGSPNSYQVLSPSLHNDAEFLCIEYPPGNGKPDFNDNPDVFSHDGMEHFYVLEGTLEFYVNSSRYIINEGDSGVFDSSNSHYFINPTNRMARIIICALNTAL